MNLFEYYKDLSNSQISRKININSGTVGQYRTGKLIPSSNTIINIYKITKKKVKPQDWFEYVFKLEKHKKELNNAK